MSFITESWCWNQSVMFKSGLKHIWNIYIFSNLGWWSIVDGGIHVCEDGRSQGGCGQSVNSCSCQVSVIKRIYVELPSGDLGVLHSTLSSWVIKTWWDRCGFRSYGPVAVFGLLMCWFFGLHGFHGFKLNMLKRDAASAWPLQEPRGSHRRTPPAVARGVLWSRRGQGRGV